ncbi:aldo/keto reductase [Streptomyces tubercidicus]|uniref:NADP-dependent oxidoreductase domain-containing protein n=1 Tax=Streptomyces tubercidicus TaxID=47759 RepID=A0A640UQX5_9ACTN|nr:aldo/keto reductase [Streptomyces tubercidicus]WAU11789.1 aldo/keto reductase [Streptomyces tubercidicus]GFE37111.1 hypothetical protein Stube_17840 [Streptomyces tubercidicus]
MKQRQLGTHGGPAVSALGLGCMGMSTSYGVPDDAESVRTLDRATELGVTLLDTADAYGRGANEEFLGRWLRGRTRARSGTGWSSRPSSGCGTTPPPGG